VVGETIGNFKVISRLGVGGMGEVWLAEQQSIGTRVAIKLLNALISQDTEHVQRFFNEARAVSRIQHAGIVKIFDVGRHGGQAYLIMEYLEGETLAQRLKRTKRLPIARIADIGRQIATVLDATHNAGITHRDLKPDNVFLVPDRELGERVKILDFGIAKLTGTLADVSPRTIGSMGTPAYMAPEQWGDASKVDWRADLYSLGCLAFEMTAGRPPFIATNIAEACGKHLNVDPPRVSSLVPTAPAKLEQLLDQLLAKDPADRPPSMKEVARAFEGVETREEGVAPTLAMGAVALPASTVPPGRRRTVPILAAVSTLAAGAAITIYLFNGAGPSVAREPSRETTAAAPVVQDAANAQVASPPATPPVAPSPAPTAPMADAAVANASEPDAAPMPSVTPAEPAQPSPSASKTRTKAPKAGAAAPPSAGNPDSDAMAQAVHTRESQTNHCYEVARHEDSTLAGMVTLQIKIDGNGRVIDATADGLTEKLQACLIAQVRTITFPKPQNPPVSIVVPFRFEAD
jgi:hypothetical protein